MVDNLVEKVDECLLNLGYYMSIACTLGMECYMYGEGESCFLLFCYFTIWRHPLTFLLLTAWTISASGCPLGIKDTLCSRK